MQTTTNIGLKTYEANDPTDWLGEFNYNMNKIDTAVGTQNQTITLIGANVTTAVNTANTASATASEALQTASTKASIDDNVASASTTYSSNKIKDLISGIQPGTEIDDNVTSTTKTWSSSKINDLLDDIDPIPYTGDSDNTVTNHTATVTTYSDTPNVKKLSTGSISISTPGYYYLKCETTNSASADRNYCFSIITCTKGNRTIFTNMKDQPKRNFFQTSSASFGSPLTSNIYYIPANTNIEFTIYSDYFTSDSYTVELHKIN